MKLTFLGATHEVTGSATLIEVNGHYGLVDYGMEQGKDVFYNEPLPIAEKELDFVLLTHAHIDHSGNIPLLVKKGFKGLIFATGATCKLAGIMLRDSAHIQESDAEWQNRKSKRAGKNTVEPLYTVDDAERTVKYFVPCEYDKKIEVSDDVTVRFTDAGHLMGSASIEVWLTEDGVTKKVVFSGDIGNFDQPIIKDPQYIDEADYVITESTYGDRLHEAAATENIPYLAECIQKVLDRGGNVVIPSFAVGRTQELLYYIREIKERFLVKHHYGFPVYVDSPLANEATEVFENVDVSYLDDEARAIVESGKNPLMSEGVRLSVTSDDSKAINTDPVPKVIIAASGMCDAGRIRHHLKHNLWRPESMVLFVGYQSNGTLGRRLYDGAKQVTLYGESITVNAEIGFMGGKSGHADMNGLLKWITSYKDKPQMVFVNHGEDGAAQAYTALLQKQYGFTASTPYSGAEFDLLKAEYTKEPAGILIDKDDAKKEKTSSIYTLLVQAGERLVDLIRGMKDATNNDIKKLTEEIDKLIDRWK